MSNFAVRIFMMLSFSISLKVFKYSCKIIVSMSPLLRNKRSSANVHDSLPSKHTTLWKQALRLSPYKKYRSCTRNVLRNSVCMRDCITKGFKGVKSSDGRRFALIFKLKWPLKGCKTGWGLWEPKCQPRNTGKTERFFFRMLDVTLFRRLLLGAVASGRATYNLSNTYPVQNTYRLETLQIQALLLRFACNPHSSKSNYK